MAEMLTQSGYSAALDCHTELGSSGKISRKEYLQVKGDNVSGTLFRKSALLDIRSGEEEITQRDRYLFEFAKREYRFHLPLGGAIALAGLVVLGGAMFYLALR